MSTKRDGSDDFDTLDTLDVETLAALRSAFEESRSTLDARIDEILADAKKKRGERLRSFFQARVMEALAGPLAGPTRDDRMGGITSGQPAAGAAAETDGDGAEAGAGPRRSSREVMLSLFHATDRPVSRSDARAAVLAEGLGDSAFKKVWQRMLNEGVIGRVADGEGYVLTKDARGDGETG